MGSVEKNPLSAGDRFGRLTIIERLDSTKSIYRCKCDCGKIKDVYKNNLVHGRTTSCGCRHKEVVSNLFSKQNDFTFVDDYVVGKASNTGNEFFIDLADYEKVKGFCWHEMKNGYIATKGKTCTTLHRFLMNPPDDLVIDHLNHNRKDNRRKNLRVCTVKQNNQNRANPPIGIQIKQQGKRTYYHVVIKGKYVGTYKDYERAKEARDLAWGNGYD